ncbi:MAG: LL-diaminopimelate aminotransferase [Candidatus Omnitrophica bacterium]|nr:LL-diaminopimelate aminotransferase [Candidatus Omnitrophota bacterium]
MFKIATRINLLPSYLFVEIDRAKREAKKQGRDIIDFGVGDPDQPTPFHIIDALKKAVDDPGNHRYALDQGIPRLRQAIADWYLERFKVKLDSENEILPLIGSKEGIAHFPLAFLDVSDYALVPDPCYPPYRSGTILAGGKVYSMALLSQNDFLPIFEDIPPAIVKKSRIMFINYPNNPTTAIAEKDFYKRVVEFAMKNKIIVVSDAAYSEITYDGYRAPSFLEIPGAKEVGIEFHSLSKTYNMTGWRIGWACGNKKLISALSKVKSNIDSGIFLAIQWAAITALKGPQKCVEQMRQLYQERRDLLVEGLLSLGWEVKPPLATFYLWLKIPIKQDSIKFAKFLLNKADIVVTPGVGFGKCGEGFVRFSLTVSKERIKEAITRIKGIL